METVSISDFRAHLLKYLQKAQRGKTILVSSHGKLVAAISAPVDQQTQATQALEQIAKQAVIGDILSPTGEQWKSLQ